MELDLAFCCDCTGSMGSYIASAQQNIRAIATEIHAKAEGKAKVRYGLVKYRDHPPQDSTFVTEVFSFTDNIELMKHNIDTMAAAGGGDGPEAVSAALHEVNNLEWRPNATKVCVFIADAPPHGLGESGDGFPQGCPLGTDPIKTCKEMAAKGIVVYAIGVEPVLSTSFKFARDFMMMVAKTTEGKFLPLGKAEILGKIIVSGAMEGVNMNAVWENLESEIAKEAAAKGESLEKEELVNRVQARLSEKRAAFVSEQVEVDCPYLDDKYDQANCNVFSEAMDLSSARAKLNPTSNAHVAQQSAGYNWGKQEAHCYTSAMSSDQADRMYRKAAKAHK